MKDNLEDSPPWEESYTGGYRRAIMSSDDWISIEQQYYMQTVRRQPVVLKRGQGAWVWDVDGKEYLDFCAGWASNNLGHCHPSITNAIIEQSKNLLQTSNQFYTIPQLLLAKLLVDNSCLDRVFFCNSGAEAIEGSIKLARKYAAINRPGAYEIITAFNSFHGRTLTTLAATGQPHYQRTFQPLIPGFVHVEYNNIEAIMEATNDNTIAVMLEPIQGEGGVNIPSDDYLGKVRQWCDKKGLILILDEIQTGIGRLGTLFGYQAYDIEPDVIALAKGLGGGVPIGAFLSKKTCLSLEPGDHGSTFGGNALTCAAAYGSTKHIIENDVPSNARIVGSYFMDQLNGIRSRYDFISDIRGKGLLIAVEFDKDISGKVIENCNHAGLLLNPVKPNTIRFMPPLIITRREVDVALTRLESALVKV